VAALYDTIGQDYRRYRQPDPRIRDAIVHRLGDARTVVNVGAGTGSYEPSDRLVVAVEPSMVMIRQRTHDAALAVQATATALPFRDAAFDASMAVLTIHHWQDLEKGLLELRRVTGHRIVIVTWEADRQVFPTLPQIGRVLGAITVSELPIPHDCSDGFLGAYWRRPDAYLNDGVRSAISTFSKLEEVSSGLQRLRLDLDAGEWHRRYGSALNVPELDLGYRLIVSD
jgi:SAM-dependent methyltransferase